MVGGPYNGRPAAVAGLYNSGRSTEVTEANNGGRPVLLVGTGNCGRSAVAAGDVNSGKPAMLAGPGNGDSDRRR